MHFICSHSPAFSGLGSYTSTGGLGSYTISTGGCWLAGWLLAACCLRACISDLPKKNGQWNCDAS
jgi:hypothetical protein